MRGVIFLKLQKSINKLGKLIIHIFEMTRFKRKLSLKAPKTKASRRAISSRATATAPTHL
jgi:hypothetical protein